MYSRVWLNIWNTAEYKIAYGAYKRHYGARATAFAIECALYVLHSLSVSNQVVFLLVSSYC